MREFLAEHRATASLNLRSLLGSPSSNYHRRSTLTRVSLTVALPVQAMLVNQWLRPQLQPAFEPAFTAAVAIVSWLCGAVYGTAALALSAALLLHFFLTPFYGLLISEPSTILKFCFFLGANGVIVGLIANLYEAQADAAASGRMYRNFSELIPFGGWICDRDGSLQHISASFLNTFGVELKDCTGLGWTKLIDEDQRPLVAAEWQECMRSGYFWDYEYRMKSKTGEPLAVLSRGVPLHDPAGRLRAWVGIHLDVTERQRSADERVRQARDIARFHAELQQLAYVSAHDLQEPLRMIASYLQLLERRYSDRLDDDARQFIAYAVEGATRLRSLLQDLLLLQTVGTSTGNRSSHDLTDLVATAIRNLGVPALTADIQYAGLPRVVCNESEFVQLFEHLLSNALKYARENVPPEISVTAERSAGGVTISLRDNGIGIDPAYVHRIFEVFQRLHPRSQYEGTGIGLAICRKIVEVHGGRIWAESTPGEGSTFFFTVPDPA